MFLDLTRAIREEVVTLLFHAEVTPTRAQQLQAAQGPDGGGNGALSYEHQSLAGAEAILAAGGTSTAAVPVTRAAEGSRRRSRRSRRSTPRSRTSAGTTPAGAAPARSSRSATAPERAPEPATRRRRDPARAARRGKHVAGVRSGPRGRRDTARFTLIPSRADRDVPAPWLARYEGGWEDGSAPGSRSARGAGGDPRLRGDRPARPRRARGRDRLRRRARGARPRRRPGRVDLLTAGASTSWGSALELRIDPANEPSARIAERAGYRLEGALRNDVLQGRPPRPTSTIWARLATRLIS